MGGPSKIVVQQPHIKEVIPMDGSSTIVVQNPQFSQIEDLRLRIEELTETVESLPEGVPPAPLAPRPDREVRLREWAD
jgi:hypothetical protein